MRHVHRVLQFKRLQDLAEDLAAPDFVDLFGTVLDDVPDAAAFEVLLFRSDGSLAGHFAKA
jgi:hypothetical protein